MAIKVWDQMKAEGGLPVMHMFFTLINNLCHENKLEEACMYIQKCWMRVFGLQKSCLAI